MRIGIVGAGISGLSAAHALMKKGYTDICVMDGSDRVGGKCHTILYQGKTYEMGAIMALPSHKHILGLMRRFHLKPSGVPLSRGHYHANGQLAAQLPAEQRKGFIEQLGRLPHVLSTYPWLKRLGFSDCPEPLSQPFSKWCEYHDLQTLQLIYEQCFTTFGFGDVEQVPAGYVLKTITPDNLMGFLEISRILTWSKGTSALLERMADQVPELWLTQRVLRITPNPTSGDTPEGDTSTNPAIQVTLSSGVETFDRLIFTADLTQLPELMPMDDSLARPLAYVKWEDFHVYAFKLKGLPELCGYVPMNLSPHRRGHMTIWYQRWPSHSESEIVTVYAYGAPEFSESERIRLLTEDLTALGCSDIRLYQSKVWKHFPHFGPEVMGSGFYRQLEDLQGKNGIYLCGELLAGSSMELCAAYSEQLVQQHF